MLGAAVEVPYEDQEYSGKDLLFLSKNREFRSMDETGLMIPIWDKIRNVVSSETLADIIW